LLELLSLSALKLGKLASVLSLWMLARVLLNGEHFIFAKKNKKTIGKQLTINN
jgi:hypothetical protein